MPDLVLSLFPGIDLLGRAFQEAGFCVVAGPDKLWGEQIQNWHPKWGVFNGIIGGSPCLAFSSLRHMVAAVHGPEKVQPSLIPEFERVVAEAMPLWFLHENAPASPAVVVPNYAVADFLLNNRELGGEQCRQRRISFGIRQAQAMDLRAFLDYVALERGEWHPAVTCDAREQPVRLDRDHRPKRPPGGETLPHVGNKLSLAEMCIRQGLPADFFDGSPFTEKGKRTMIGNGVPMMMGRALAEAIKRALAKESNA